MQSEQNWHGIKSNKFNHSERIHVKPDDQLKDFAGHQMNPILGRVHYQEKFGKLYQYVPHMKVDIPRPGDGQTQEFAPGKKNLKHEAQEKRPRAELRHLQETKSGHIEDIPYGIKTFPKLRCEQRHEIEEMMGQKKRVEYLSQMRNGLSVQSLGDKSYKHPDYSSNFYKEGGLVVGSTNVQGKVNVNQLHEKEMEKKIQLIQSRIKKGTLWSEKVKLDYDKEKQNDIDDLDKWVENTLKPSNPNYQDPDKFFENLEKQQQQDPKKGQPAKKGGKK